VSDGPYEVVTTESGALAVRCRASGEVMHPVVGPAVEARTLYVEPARLRERLAEPRRDPLVVLDVGLGAGSNALAALALSEAQPAEARRLELVSFDRTLAPLALALEHASAFGFAGSALAAANDLLARGRHESARTGWRLVPGDLLEALAGEPAEAADVVFWDPFSPRVNPALWSVGAFRALHRLCRAGATVHTYSAAPATRTALLLAGFFVGLGPPSGRKGKPTTVASTSLAAIDAPLTAAWLAQLARSRVPLPPDAPADALARLADHPQLRSRDGDRHTS